MVKTMTTLHRLSSCLARFPSRYAFQGSGLRKSLIGRESSGIYTAYVTGHYLTSSVRNTIFARTRRRESLTFSRPCLSWCQTNALMLGVWPVTRGLMTLLACVVLRLRGLGLVRKERVLRGGLQSRGRGKRRMPRTKTAGPAWSNIDTFHLTQILAIAVLNGPTLLRLPS